ncbi:hypothetical protein LEP1GSC193_3839 [Leptospira alstonii serovar Pingchang str. 80-412]|uniref:Uncharacterized protein n=1 Tax=Leptospira alstonii serovar Pingchang str. 80-412 TaxID=1218564 RepID=T0FWG2_9LEPT|nr:hypothetical protein LEP1GSC193_3839 [Leptospira alstonii serovar Pingchang str. 80-412]
MSVRSQKRNRFFKKSSFGKAVFVLASFFHFGDTLEKMTFSIAVFLPFTNGPESSVPNSFQTSLRS